jgi:hypothetical protein
MARLFLPWSARRQEGAFGWRQFTAARESLQAWARRLPGKEWRGTDRACDREGAGMGWMERERDGRCNDSTGHWMPMHGSASLSYVKQKSKAKVITRASWSALRGGQKCAWLSLAWQEGREGGRGRARQQEVRQFLPRAWRGLSLPLSPAKSKQPRTILKHVD